MSAAGATSASSRRQPSVVKYRFSCPICGQAYQRASGLERHRLSVHLKEKPYLCDYCTLAFSRTDLLRRHVSLYHKGVLAAETKLQALQGAAQLNKGIGNDALTQPNVQQTSQLEATHLEPGIPPDAPLQDLSALFATDIPTLSPLRAHIEAEQSHSASSTLSIDTAPTEMSSFLEILPPTSSRHLDLYCLKFARHLPFVHLANFLDSINGDRTDEDKDLSRAMTIIGANYESVEQGAIVPFKWCDYYECGALKDRVSMSIVETKADNDLQSSRRSLLRRTQTFILIQIVAMFSESKKHMMAAKLSHGTLIVVARELLNDVKADLHLDATNWRDWVRKEEAIRTLWAVYIVDGLQAFAYSRSPWFTLSDLSELPDVSSNELWEAQDEATFANLRLLHSPHTTSSVFGFVSALKDHASHSQLLSKDLSLSGSLLTLVSISTTITSMMHTDASARKNLATRFQSIPWFDQSSEVPDSVEELCQSLFSLDADLRNKIQDLNRLFSRLLDSLQVSSSFSKIKSANGPTPFIEDFMPWYWVCVHLLRMLEDRLGSSEDEREVELNGTELAYSFKRFNTMLTTVLLISCAYLSKYGWL